MRLIGGMAQALVEKPYQTMTIADIVRHARVSKRTFYEHFEDKEACFLACYATMSELALQTVETGAAGALPWREQVHQAAKSYLSALEAQPALTRALLMEILAAGPAALRLRRDVLMRFAGKLRKLVQRGRKHDRLIRPLSEAMALAIVGGIHELTLLAVEQGRADHLTELANTATELITAVLTPRPES